VKKPKKRISQKKAAKKPESSEITRLKTIIASKDREIKTLTEISRTIVSGQYMEEILSLIVTLTAEMMGSKICSIMLHDEKKKELKIIATQSLSEEYKNKPNVKVGQSISGRAFIEQKPAVILDVRKEKDYMYTDIAKKEGFTSMLCVPMIVRGKAIGVVNIYTAEVHSFTDDEIRILQSVSNQAAIGIDNMNLMNEALLAREQLETRKLIERAKGILMKKFSMDENTAYKTIHKKSMDTRKSMKEVAEAIILTLEMDK